MFPDLTPLDPAQREMLQKGLSSLRPEQLVWLSGYLSGRASGFLPENAQGILPTGGGMQGLVAGAAPQQLAAVAPVEALKVLVLYGTESGNSEALADRFAKSAKKKGFKPTLKNMSEIAAKDLEKHDNIITLVSTWGDGEPPETADAFYKEFMSADLQLSGKNFSVLALGDTSYEKFCQTGKDIDARFETLGASRLADRKDCDVDYEDEYEAWAGEVLGALEKLKPAAAELPVTQTTGDISYATTEQVSAYDKKNPFPAEVTANVNLNGTGSSKETVHVEFSLEGSGLQYEAGDALAVVPENAPDVVEDFLKSSGLNADETVEVKNAGSVSLKEALTSHLDITSLSRKVVTSYAGLTGSPVLNGILEEGRKDEFKQFIWGRQIVDLFSVQPYEGSAQDLVNILRKLPPRLYSIASSPKAHEDEVHLTVAAVRYDSYGKERKGVASTYLADAAQTGEKVKVFVQKNKNFRLPEDPSKPIVMVGPGTGVAPFRAFVEERGETEATGNSWLFFGDQRYSYDFLYQLEWQDHLKEGNLTKLDVAFSRDQPEKVYVQHKMLENAPELWDWINNQGGYFYVCGDAERMAGDVHNALIQIAVEQGGMSEADAITYFENLKKEKRYQRDVY